MDTNYGTLAVTGEVIDADTETGVHGLKVEAMDNSKKITEPLAIAKTDVNGRFKMAVNYRKFEIDNLTDICFNVFDTDGKTLLTSTEDYVLWNSGSQEDVTILVQGPDEISTGKDRLNAEQAVNIVNFLSKSDFKGLFTQGKSKAGASFGFLGDAFMNSLAHMSLTPIAVPVQSSDIVGSDVPSATRTLSDQNISYNVKDYNPKLNKDFFTAFMAASPIVKSGQTVNLYQENDMVKYYALQDDSQPTQEPVNPPENGQSGQIIQPGDYAKIQEQLNSSMKDAAQKDEMISRLSKQLELMQKDQNEMKDFIKSKFS